MTIVLLSGLYWGNCDANENKKNYRFTDTFHIITITSNLLAAADKPNRLLYPNVA
jgi:hypothetical protein